MTSRRDWYLLNTVSWLIGIPVILWIIPILFHYLPSLVEQLGGSDSEHATVLWLMLALPIVMRIDLRSRAGRRSPLLYALSFVSLVLAQMSIGVFALMIAFGASRIPYLFLLLIFIDAALIRTLISRVM